MSYQKEQGIKEIKHFLACSKKISEWMNKHYATGGRSSKEVVIDQLLTAITVSDAEKSVYLRFIKDVLFVVNAEILMGGNSLIRSFFEEKDTNSFLNGLDTNQLVRLRNQVKKIANFILTQISTDLGKEECEMAKSIFILLEKRLNTYRGE